MKSTVIRQQARTLPCLNTCARPCVDSTELYVEPTHVRNDVYVNTGTSVFRSRFEAICMRGWLFFRLSFPKTYLSSSTSPPVDIHRSPRATLISVI